MSRVSYVMLNPGSERELTRAVRGCLAKLTAELARAAEIDRRDVLEVTLVGNPIMHHLLLGIDPTPLGAAPFSLAVDEAVRLPARDVGIPVTGARAYVLPCIAGHVGADTAGVLLSEAPYLGDRGQPRRRRRHERGDRARQPRPCSRRRAPPAPPSRRADLVRSARGAGCRRARSHRPRDARAAVARDRRRLVRRGRVRRGPGDGVCGSGIIEAVAELYLASVLTTDGTIDGASPSARRGSSRTRGRSRTSSGWRAGARDHAERTCARSSSRRPRSMPAARCCSTTTASSASSGSGSRAFGTHIDPVHALVLGLVPDCDPERVTAAGNAARTGARIALLNRSARPRSKTSCAASRRSRLRSSHASRSTS